MQEVTDTGRRDHDRFGRLQRRPRCSTLSSGALLARSSIPWSYTCGLLVAMLRRGGGGLRLRAGISSGTGPVGQGPIGICGCLRSASQPDVLLNRVDHQRDDHIPIQNCRLGLLHSGPYIIGQVVAEGAKAGSTFTHRGVYDPVHRRVVRLTVGYVGIPRVDQVEECSVSTGHRAGDDDVRHV